MSEMEDWADSHNGVGLPPEYSRSDAMKAAALLSTMDERVEALWREHLPDIAAGRVEFSVRSAAAGVIGALLRGEWVPRKVRQEAHAEWMRALVESRDRAIVGRDALLADIEALEAEQGLLTKRIAELQAQLGDPSLTADSILDGIHRLRAQQP